MHLKVAPYFHRCSMYIFSWKKLHESPKSHLTSGATKICNHVSFVKKSFVRRKTWWHPSAVQHNITKSCIRFTGYELKMKEINLDKNKKNLLCRVFFDRQTSIIITLTNCLSGSVLWSFLAKYLCIVIPFQSFCIFGEGTITLIVSVLQKLPNILHKIQIFLHKLIILLHKDNAAWTPNPAA